MIFQREGPYHLPPLWIRQCTHIKFVDIWTDVNISNIDSPISITVRRTFINYLGKRRVIHLLQFVSGVKVLIDANNGQLYSDNWIRLSSIRPDNMASAVI